MIHSLPVFDASINCLPFISIIIPTLNEESFIEQTLNQISIQSYPQELVEVFVVDGGSSDRTCELVAKWSEKSELAIRILFNQNKMASCARNMGVRAARGEYVLFIDAHVFIPSVVLVESMVRTARDQKALVLGRAQPLTPPLLSGFQKIVAGVRSSKWGHSTKSYIYSDYEGWVSPVSVGVMYHRSIFDNAGYFDESFDAAEDVEFNFRIESNGYKAYISPEFKVLYYPRETFLGLMRQMFRYGVGRARFTKKHIKGFQGELFVPIGILISLLGFFLLSASHSTLFTFIVIVLCSYFLAVAMLFKSFTAIGHSFFAPICLLTIHVCLAIGLLVGMVERQSLKVNK